MISTRDLAARGVIQVARALHGRAKCRLERGCAGPSTDDHALALPTSNSIKDHTTRAKIFRGRQQTYMTAFVNDLNPTLYEEVMDCFFGKRFGLNAMRAIQRREPNRLQIKNTVSINWHNMVLWYQKRSTVPLYINSPSR